MKKIIYLLSAFVFLSVSSLPCFATSNILHTIVLEKKNDSYNVILDSDSMAKVTKHTPSRNELTLDVNGVVSDGNVNALYRGSGDVDSLVIENGNNQIKITIKADNIKNSTIMVEPKDGVATIVGETAPIDKILWVLCLLAVLSVIFRVATKSTEEDNKLLIKKDIKDREIQLYKRYLNDFNSTNPIINRKIPQKIDRKIEERLTRF